jgi:hypothetical protein
MKRLLLAGIALLPVVGAAFVVHGHLFAASQNQPLAHAQSEFHFTVNAPAETATRLFGAAAERSWSKDWHPDFVYPTAPADVQGAVFKVHHGHHSSTWVTTVYAPGQGHVEHVASIDGQMLMTIDIHVTPRNDRESDVTVTYDRTALNPSANEHIQALAAADADSGPHWASAINGYLQQTQQQP